jgi:hypothetical protein
MKNVMTKAWEIAYKGQKQFGGKVKEYFAEALRMAWEIIKKGASKLEIGYQEIQKKNGTLHFLVNDIEGVEVSYLTEGQNPYNGKTYTKRNSLPYKSMFNKKINQAVRLYSISIHAGDIEMKCGGDVEILKNSIDRSKWGFN